jgi:hypothetical protein
MRKYFKELMYLALLAIITVLAAGCGDGGFDTESRLGVSLVKPGAVVSDIVEETDDYGEDGVADTDDNGEGDGRPTPGEEILTPLTQDTLTVTFTNTVREGSEQGEDIKITDYIITYYDSTGTAPLYAPQKHNIMTLTVQPGTTAEFEFVIVDLAMKEGTATIRGLRDIFLFWPTLFNNTLFAQIDFYGRSVKNNEPAVAVAEVTIIFTDVN